MWLINISLSNESNVISNQARNMVKEIINVKMKENINMA